MLVDSLERLRHQSKRARIFSFEMFAIFEEKEGIETQKTKGNTSN